MLTFTEKAIAAVLSIPEGQVTTYGQIARIAGNPRAARQVSRLLHTLSVAYLLPWHRVVNREGQIVLRDPASFALQKALLEAEGLTVGPEGKVLGLERVLWQGPEDKPV